MDLDHFRFELDGDGVATLTWDSPGRSMNVITEAVMAELDRVIDRVAGAAGVRGCVVTAGKPTFSGGADLGMLRALGAAADRAAREGGAEAGLQAFFAQSRRLSLLFRKLETCGKPWVAAINGLCLGGAFELALACHHRVVADHGAARVGLPEIKVGLIPGAGGTQRVARLVPTDKALPVLLRGEQVRPRDALALGLVHALAPAAELVAVAKRWIAEGGKPVAPWDEPGFRPPSGRVYSAAGLAVWPAANAILRRETFDNYPAARAVLQAVHDGLQLPIDLALRVESRHFAAVLRSPEAAAMIRTLFVSTGQLNKGARRPTGVPPARIGRVGVVGAGTMGAGIALAAAGAGLDVVLVDRDRDTAEAAKARQAALLDARVAKGRVTAAERDAVLARVATSGQVGDLAGCDLAVEAVFEERAAKHAVIRALAATLSPEAVIATNTSTLPVTGLAGACERPERFLGLHFFSPVDRMALVEVVRGPFTADRAVAAGFDLVRALNKTPIVVGDGRGFYANRCVQAYVDEGHAMLREGVPAALVEASGRMAGMPLGPLALSDEVGLDLCRAILRAAAQDGLPADPALAALYDALVVTHGRLGRKNRKGFYDHPEGADKRLWPGLAGLQPRRLDPDRVDVDALKRRVLTIQALAAARAVEDGVVTDPREADVGSVLGFGFAPFTGGTLSYIDRIGAGAFALACDALAKAHGPRFTPPALLLDMAQANQSFYGRFGQP